MFTQILGLSGPLTHRQYLTWLEWDRDQWERPSRSDFYTMQLTCEVRRLLAKHPNQVKLQNCILKFGDKDKGPIDPEEATRRSKAAWFGILRLGPDGKPLEGVKRSVIKMDSQIPKSGVQHPLGTSSPSSNR